MNVEEAILEKVRSLAPEQQQRVLDFAESLGHQKRGAIADSDRSSESCTGQPLHDQGATSYVPKTPLGQRLRELRQEAISAGMKLSSAEEIEEEIAEQRDRHRGLYEDLS